MAINVSVQFNVAGLFPDIILLTQCHYHRGTRLNAMKKFLSLQPMIPCKHFHILPPDWGVLRRSRCVQFKNQKQKKRNTRERQHGIP